MAMESEGRLNVIAVVLSSAVILNFGYLSSVVYGTPEYISLILLPVGLGLLISRFTRNVGKSLQSVFLFFAVASVLMLSILLLPLLAGLFPDETYADLFSFIIMTRVFRNMILAGGHTLISNLVGVLAWGSE